MSSHTSGTYLFNPNLAKAVDEAFERIGKDPQKILFEHVESARRSINYLLAEWATFGVTHWKIETVELPLVANQQDYTIPTDTMDILSGVIRYVGVDTWVNPVSDNDWLGIPDKTVTGRTDRYNVQRLLSGITLKVWPIPDLNEYTFVYNRMVKYQDAGTAQNTPDIPYYFQNAFVDGLAAKLARKYAVDRLDEAIKIATVSFFASMSVDADNSDLAITVNYGG